MQIRCVAENGEQLVLGCFDHKGLHHAATKLATMQRFFMLVLLYDLLRILLDRGAQEVLKARANSNVTMFELQPMYCIDWLSVI